MDIEMNELHDLLKRARQQIVDGTPCAQILATLDEGIKLVEIFVAMLTLPEDEDEEFRIGRSD